MTGPRSPDASAYRGGRLGGSDVGGFGEYTFSGTWVEVRGPVWPGGASAVEVFVDGVSHGVHSQRALETRHGVLLCRVEDLAPGEHTLRIEQLDGRPGFAGIDYLRVGLKG